jgi:hypothetical protein
MYVGLARSNPSPIVSVILRFVPVLEDEGGRVDEEKIRNLFNVSGKKCLGLVWEMEDSSGWKRIEGDFGKF